MRKFETPRIRTGRRRAESDPQYGLDRHNAVDIVDDRGTARSVA
ncbi:hypothetical protein ACU686_30905 [Yinghuangia aomiensis]